jgi:glyoxylase-like metal-dependent hydrolase (beta-lactamase superfamily II)
MSSVLHRFAVGDVAAALVYDGSIRIAPNVIFPADRRSEWPEQELDSAGEFLCPVSCLLIWSSNGLVLVDAGNGTSTDRKFAGGGDLLDNLRASGIDPDSIDVVVITHAHGDHFGGIVSGAMGAPVPSFPRARHLISRPEWEHARARVGESPYVASALLPLEASGLLTPVAMDARVSSQVFLLPASGHTPGHVVVKVESGSGGLLFLGDAIHHPIQFANPDLVSSGDYDRLEVPACRRRLCDLAIEEDLLVCGSHFDFPRAYRLRRNGAGYAVQSV